MSDIVVIDLNSLGVPIWMTSSSDANPDAASIRIVERVRALTSGVAHAAIAIDCPPYFRKDIYPEYKAQRPPAEEPMRFQINKAAEILRADGYPILGVRGFEGDDIAATIVTHVLASRRDDSVLIVSSDKDLCALVGPRVRLKSVKDGSIIDEAAVQEKFGVPPSKMVDLLALWGDASDGIKGADKVGQKIGASLLAEFGSLDAIFKAFDSGATPTMTPNLRTRLQEFRPRADLVRSVIRLRTDVPIPFDELFKPRVPLADDVITFGDDGDEMQNRPTPTEIAGVREAAKSMFADDIAEAFTPADARAEIDAVMPRGESNAEREADTAHRQIAADGQVVRHDSLQEEDRRGPVNGGGGQLLRGDGEVRRIGSDVGNSGSGSQALTPVVVDYERQLEPRDLASAFKLAESMFQSRLFSAYGSPHAVLSTILAGREFGMPAMASLRAMHIVEGKPMLAADTIRALVLRSGAAEYFRCTERTAERATFVTKRRGENEMSLTYTLAEGRTAFAGDDAKFAKSGWGKNPADMCVARAGAKLARLVYPDVVHGLYCREEIEQ